MVGKVEVNDGAFCRLGGTIPVGVPGCRAGNLTTRECGDEIQVAEVMWPADGLLVAVIRNPGHPAMSFSSDAVRKRLFFSCVRHILLLNQMSDVYQDRIGTNIREI